MGFIKTLLFTGLFLTTGCSMQTNIISHKALLVSPCNLCLEEVNQKIKKLTGLSQIKLSNDLFSKSSLLVLSNHPSREFRGNDPMVGVYGSEKIIVLYQISDICYIGLLDENGNILKKEKISNCHCKRKEAY